jgi:uncharacterized protein YjiS (DUF1127 family)
MTMATIARSQNRTVGRFLIDGVQSLNLRFQASVAETRERRRIARELSTYTDAELGELGFSRYDIPAVAAGTFRR